MQYQRSLPKNIFAICELSAGRFLAYLTVGAAAGMLSKHLYIEGKELLTAAGYFLFSIFLLITVFRTHKRDQCCSTARGTGVFDRPLLLGILTGVNICPPFLLALTKAYHGSGPVAGMLLFAAFFVGTTLFLLPISAFGLLGGQKIFRSVARWGAIAVSVWFLFQAGLQTYNIFW
jgi:sulfite exporter TauE/SafE